MENDNIFNFQLSLEKCFICGKDFSENIPKTEEHVFPKWLQHQCKLWDQHIILLNGTDLLYKNLKVPCCKECNTKYLQEIEKLISESAKLGYEQFIKLDELKIFQWILKIYYGIHYKEFFLCTDRKNPNNGTILNKDDIDRFKMLHFLLQSTYKSFTFNNATPWSIFIFKTLKYPDERNFFYHDTYNGFCSLRFNDIGIIVIFEDNGIHKEFFKDKFVGYNKISLADFQFDEICAIINYKYSLFNRVPKYLIEEQEDSFNIFFQPVNGLSTSSPWNMWNAEEFKIFLLNHLGKYGIPEEKIISTKNNHTTFIKDQTGCYLNQYDVNGKIKSLVAIAD